MQTQRFLDTLRAYLMEVHRMLIQLHREANAKPKTFVRLQTFLLHDLCIDISCLHNTTDAFSFAISSQLRHKRKRMKRMLSVAMDSIQTHLAQLTNYFLKPEEIVLEVLVLRLQWQTIETVQQTWRLVQLV